MKRIILPFCILCWSFLGAQVQTSYNNLKPLTEKGHFNQSYANTILSVTPPDTSVIIARQLIDKNSKQIKPFRFAEHIKVSINVADKGNWAYDQDYAYCKLDVQVDKAKSLSINFNRFYLPEGSEMYIYNNKGLMITGPITSRENNVDSAWGSSVYKGDMISIEIRLPIDQKSKLTLNISNIAYGYKDVFGAFCCGFGQSGACEINVLCALGANWVNQRFAVARIIGDQGATFFTGEMIDNTCNLNIPYLLTANHALDNSVGTWQIEFQYWSPQCNPNQNNNNFLLFNGATLRASNMNSDFALVQLNQTPPVNSNITYLGWNRNINPAANTVGIHHPQGDVMKICSDANPPVLANWNSPPFNNVQLNWWSAHFQQGTVEPGSSGSALYDQNQRVIGQLSGNPNTTGNYCAEQIGDYGRFDLSWNAGRTNATQLSNWLDPGNTGAMTTNTININALANLTNLVITGPSNFCTTGQYSVNTTLPVTWTASPTGIVQIGTPNLPQTTLSILSGGLITLKATVNTACGPTNSISLSIAVGAPAPTVTVNLNCPEGMAVATNAPGATTFTWTLVDVSTGNQTINSNYGSTINYKDLQGTHNIGATYNNSCGTSQPGVVRNVFCSGGGHIIIAPNPSNGIINVSIAIAVTSPNTDGAIASSFPYKILQVNVIDQSAMIREIYTYPDGVAAAKLNLSSLPNGVYILTINNGQAWESHQVIISK